MGCLSAKVTYCHRSPQKAGTFSSWCLLLLWLSLEEVRNMEMERLQARVLGKHSVFLWPLQGSMFSYGPRERNEKSVFFFFLNWTQIYQDLLLFVSSSLNVSAWQSPHNTGFSTSLEGPQTKPSLSCDFLSQQRFSLVLHPCLHLCSPICSSQSSSDLFIYLTPNWCY